MVVVRLHAFSDAFVLTLSFLAFFGAGLLLLAVGRNGFGCKAGLWLMLCFTGLILTGCGKTPSPPLRVGMHVWPGFEPLFTLSEVLKQPFQEQEPKNR